MNGETKSDKLFRWLSWKLPKGLIYFAAIRLFAFATTNKYDNTVVPELTVMDALDRWKKG